MFKNALVYRIVHWDRPGLAALDQRLHESGFVECGATQREAAGWIAPRGERHGALVEAVAGHWILRHCSETKGVPAGVVKTLIDERLAAIEQQTGRRPKGKAVRELKEQLVHELLPRAFAKRATTWVWLAPGASWLVVGTASAKRADAIVTALMQVLGGDIRIAPVQTALSPASAMAAWLLEQQAPRGFAIDRDCELKQPSAEKASVRYARHALEIAEVAAHVRAGKLPTQLALTWASRVSFVLTEALALKRIAVLDVVVKGTGADEGGFDADVAIATGELGQLIADLIDALGGELDLDAAGAAQSIATPREPLAA